MRRRGESFQAMPRATPGGQTPRPRRHYAYLLRCGDGSFYAGYTVDPLLRLAAHQDGAGSRYTRSRGPLTLAAVWRCPTRRAALGLERLLKRLSHAAKARLALGHPIGRVIARAVRLGARRQTVDIRAREKGVA